MKLQQLLDLQWQEYRLNHQNRLNLVIHILTTPLFMLGSLMVPFAILTLSIVYALIGISLMFLVMVIQGVGHSREQVKPRPFANAADFMSRILAEQWITLPRYLFSGLWKQPSISD